MRFPAARAAVSLLAVGLLAGCAGSSAAPKAAAPAGNVITVSAAACGTGWRHPAAGLQTLQIRNVSAGAIEVALTDSGTGAVYARVEGIGPGTTRPIQVDVGSGGYAFECSGSDYGERVGPTVEVPGHVRGGAAIVPADVNEVITAATQSRAYVSGGLATLMGQTAVLAAKIRAGDLAAARAVWLAAHLTYERLGSAYGMFGGYDDEIDGQPDGLPGGVHDPGFGGFYRLEYGLWHGQPAAELTGPADKLDLDVRALATAWPGGMELPAPVFDVSDLALRTHEILEHAMRFQLSGQDDFGSGTTLATAAANIDATREQLKILHPMLVTRYGNLPALYSWLDRLQRLVDAADTSRGWTLVTALTTAQREHIDAAAGQTLELLAPIPVMFEARPVP
jgi:iron uptake system component EfeO